MYCLILFVVITISFLIYGVVDRLCEHKERVKGVYIEPRTVQNPSWED